MFTKDYEIWMQTQIDGEKNHRRRELLQKGLQFSSMALLQKIWYPLVGNFDHLYPEWEVRDLNKGYRYLDFAFLPPGVKADIEVHDYRSHARDLDTKRFVDLQIRQSVLSLDGWVYFPIAYLLIRDEPGLAKQLVLSFLGKFLSHDMDAQLTALEAETVRFARRIFRPFEPKELAAHLRVTDRYARHLLHKLVETNYLIVRGGQRRFRTYQLNIGESLRQR